jgi:hypothetical protein
MAFSSLADFNDRWLSLTNLRIKYAFGDPNWESDRVDQLYDDLRSKEGVGLESKCFQHEPYMEVTVPQGLKSRSVDLRIREGGDETE